MISIYNVKIMDSFNDEQIKSNLNCFALLNDFIFYYILIFNLKYIKLINITFKIIILKFKIFFKSSFSELQTWLSGNKTLIQ